MRERESEGVKHFTVLFVDFRFTATYYPRWGYFIEAINGLYGDWKNNKTFWQISNALGPLQFGKYAL